MKRTPWFPVKQSPVREGWYEYRGFLCDPGERNYWSGNQWGCWTAGGHEWIQLLDVDTDEWRGLAERPEGAE